MVIVIDYLWYIATKISGDVVPDSTGPGFGTNLDRDGCGPRFSVVAKIVSVSNILSIQICLLLCMRGMRL